MQPDRFTPADFVTGKFKIQRDQVYSADWVEILQHLATVCKPHLNDFPGFREIGGVLNGIDKHWQSETDPEIVFFPPGFTDKTRCLMLDAVDFPDVPASEKYHRKDARQFVATFLLLTSGREFASFDCRVLVYDKQRSYLDTNPKRRVFQFVQVQFLDGASLLNLLSRRHAVVVGSGLRIIAKLSYLLGKEVEERQKILASL